MPIKRVIYSTTCDNVYSIKKCNFNLFLGMPDITFLNKTPTLKLQHSYSDVDGP